MDKNDSLIKFGMIFFYFSLITSLTVAYIIMLVLFLPSRSLYFFFNNTIVLKI